MTIDQAVKKLIVKEPFYGLFLLGLNRYFDNKIETACVRRNGINIELCINETYWNSLPEDGQIAILMHEVGHILYKHFNMYEVFRNHDKLNISADMEINSDIPYLKQYPYYYPACYNMADHLGTKYYYEHIPDESSSDSGDSGDSSGNQESDSNQSSKNGNGQLVDDHSSWKDFENLGEAEKQLISNQIDYITKNTVEHIQKTCGNIPGQFKEYIDSLFKVKPAVFDWKAYFRRIIGNIITSEINLTKMRPSRRFPDGRGVRFKRKTKVLVGLDTSGSISKKDLEDFTSEVYHLWKGGVAVDIAQVDTMIHKIESYNGTFDGNIVGRGGTDFTDLINYYNKNKKDYSTLVIFTDGHVSLDLPPFHNCVWVISGGYRQEYPGTAVYIPNSK